MNTRITLGAAAILLAAAALTGCSSADDGGDDAAPTTAETTPAESAPAEESAAPEGGAASLATADSDLGTIVVDGQGMVVYQFDSDTQGSGASTCEGQCLDAWPPVHGDGTAAVDGISGELGTITGVDGQPQLTLNGWPLYYYAGDTQAGQTTGQGVGDVWWVLDPDGEPIRE
ncbi:COG4315 family predicted lipoprotein [Microbacterium rhizophilus]|uniref:COG4315 family predicted lipoprotein n=1 Tax=Microbacterium rhizophilus TaxID=3138934 RepID=UPI0031F09DB2